MRGDIFGGLTAGVVALPLALAFGVQSGMGAIAGIYGAIFIGFVASLVGGTPTQISGPTAPMTAVSMTIVAGVIQVYDGSLEKALPGILAIFILAGLFQILLGVLQLGKYIKYIPYPVVSGFMTGIGVIILVTQLLPALGYYPDQDPDFVQSFNMQAEEVMLNEVLREEVNDNGLTRNTLESIPADRWEMDEAIISQESQALAKQYSSGVVGTLKTLPVAIQKINSLELALALGTVFLIFGFRRITKAIPATLIALTIGTIVPIVFGLNVSTIGEIPLGLPIPQWQVFSAFDLSVITPFIFTAVTLAFLGSLDSLLTSVVADNKTKSRHNPNRELIGQGLGNSVAGIFGGIPGAGATIRTVINIENGGKTRLSGIVAAILLLAVIMLLGKWAQFIPSAVLSGILITVGIGVMDYKGLKAIRFIPRSDVVVMFTVLLLTIFWDLVPAVGVGMVISSLIFMKKMGDVTADSSRIIRLSESMVQTHKNYSRIPVNLKEEVYFKELKGPIFFGYTSEFTTLSSHVPDSATHVIIRMKRVPFVDQSGLFAFEEVLQTLIARGMQPLLVNVQAQVRYRMEAIKLIPALVGDDFIFNDFDQCLEWIIENVEDKGA